MEEVTIVVMLYKTTLSVCWKQETNSELVCEHLMFC